MRSRGKVTTKKKERKKRRKKKTTNPNWSAPTIVCALCSHLYVTHVCTFVQQRSMLCTYTYNTHMCMLMHIEKGAKKKEKEKITKEPQKKTCNDAVGTNV